MRKAALAVSICVFLMPTTASALDWSLNSTASETVELNDNQFLRTLPAGTLGSYSTVTANAEARTPTSKFDFDSDVNYKKYWGPGADGVPENLAYGFKGHYETTGKTSPDREFLEANFRQQSTAFALLGELGIPTKVQGALDTLTASGGIDRSLGALDTVSLFAHSTRTSYEPSGGGTPFQDTSATGSWRHRLDSIATLTASSEAEWLAYDNAFGTNVIILRNTAGIEATLSPLLSFRGTAGAAYVQTDHGVGTPTATGGAAGTPAAVSSAQIGFITDMLLTYKALKNTTFTLAGSQTIGPSVVGSLFTRTTISAGAIHTINAASTLSFSADVSRSVSSSTTDFASASVSYGYQFAREWNAHLSYRYLHRFATSGTATVDPITNTPIVSGTGPASSNGVTVVVSKSFAVLAHTD